MFWRFLRIETGLQFLAVPMQSQLMLFLSLFNEMWKAFILSLLLSKMCCAEVYRSISHQVFTVLSLYHVKFLNLMLFFYY